FARFALQDPCIGVDRGRGGRGLARDEQEATLLPDHREIAAVERLQLRGGDPDSADPAAVRKMPRDVRVLGVQRLAGKQPGELAPAFPVLARACFGFALLAFALLALAAFAQRPGAREVDFPARIVLALPARLRPLARRFPARGAGLRCGLARRVAHGP